MCRYRGDVEDDTVAVWLIPADLPDDVVAGYEHLLDERERERAYSFRLAEHRWSYIAAHGAARVIVGRCLDTPPQRIRWQYGQYGKPELDGAGPRFSLSHSGAVAAVAISPRRPVGVDLEKLASGIDPARMARRYFPAAEADHVAAAESEEEQAQRFVRLWTRKEACLKAAGARLSDGLGLPVGGAGPIVVRDPAGGLPGAYAVHDLPATQGFHAAVALTGEAPFIPTQRTFSPH